MWGQKRNFSFLHQCKKSFTNFFKTPKDKESCCSARAPLEEANPSHDVSTPVETAQHSPKIVIIGGGMAGLSAANHLQENGVTNITVLEALERPGGRIRSTWFGDSIIELGFPKDKDAATSPLIQMAVEDKFTTYSLNNADRSLGLLQRSDGSPISFPVAFEVYQIFKKIWHEVHDMEHQESGQSKQSTRTLLGSRVEQEARMFPLSNQLDAERVFHGLASLALSKSNHDSSMIVSNSFGDYIQLPGSNLKVPLGYFGEINALYESLPPDQVLFNKSAVKICWSGVPGVTPRAIVICEDGQSFEANYVIITTPLGVLKEKAETLFCPGLPALKLEAIMKIPMGFTNKVFVEFDDPFWKWNKDLKFCLKNQPNCDDSWLKGVCSIKPIRGSSHVICIKVGGPQAKNMESLSDQDVILDIVKLLEQSTTVKEVPKPSKIRRTSWCTDPHFYGTYTCMNTKVCSKDFYNLATPLPEQSELCDPVLLFAGEATCPGQFGTMQGAKNSGVREAERLLQLIKLQNKKEESKQMCRIQI